ncbi:MAG: cytoskeletal protein CcmA (bactofilin family) [Candidatus Azotimanducaceae bacterium]|jgi:cytoskeletal protein CcmA (bactofilin family)
MFNKTGGESGITLIANNCEVSGDLHFSDQLQINGVVKGNIYALEGSKAVITVSERGRVKGEIRVPNVIINGKVHGDVYSDKHIELAAKAEIKGNVYYNLIEMVMGSRVDGNLVNIRKDKDGKPETTQVPTPAVDTASKVAPKVAPVTTKSA